MKEIIVKRRTGLFEEGDVKGYILGPGESTDMLLQEADLTSEGFESVLRKVSRRGQPSSEASSETSE